MLLGLQLPFLKVTFYASVDSFYGNFEAAKEFALPVNDPSFVQILEASLA